MPNKRSLRKPETSNTSLGTAYDKTLDTPFNSVLGFDDTSPSANTTSSKVENDRSCSPQQSLKDCGVPRVFNEGVSKMYYASHKAEAYGCTSGSPKQTTWQRLISPFTLSNMKSMPKTRPYLKQSASVAPLTPILSPLAKLAVEKTTRGSTGSIPKPESVAHLTGSCERADSIQSSRSMMVQKVSTLDDSRAHIYAGLTIITPFSAEESSYTPLNNTIKPPGGPFLKARVIDGAIHLSYGSAALHPTQKLITSFCTWDSPQLCSYIDLWKPMRISYPSITQSRQAIPVAPPLSAAKDSSISTIWRNLGISQGKELFNWIKLYERVLIVGHLGSFTHSREPELIVWKKQTYTLSDFAHMLEDLYVHRHGQPKWITTREEIVCFLNTRDTWFPVLVDKADSCDPICSSQEESRIQVLMCSRPEGTEIHRQMQQITIDPKNLYAKAGNFFKLEAILWDPRLPGIRGDVKFRFDPDIPWLNWEGTCQAFVGRVPVQLFIKNVEPFHILKGCFLNTFIVARTIDYLPQEVRYEREIRAAIRIWIQDEDNKYPEGTNEASSNNCIHSEELQADYTFETWTDFADDSPTGSSGRDEFTLDLTLQTRTVPEGFAPSPSSSLLENRSREHISPATFSLPLDSFLRSLDVTSDASGPSKITTEDAVDTSNASFLNLGLVSSGFNGEVHTGNELDTPRRDPSMVVKEESPFDSVSNHSTLLPEPACDLSAGMANSSEMRSVEHKQKVHTPPLQTLHRKESHTIVDNGGPYTMTYHAFALNYDESRIPVFAKRISRGRDK